MNVNFGNAMAYDEGKGITREVFAEYAAKELNLNNEKANALFDQIDQNDSGGLREREFIQWGGGEAGGSVREGVSSLGNIDGVEIGSTTRLKRDSNYGGPVDDELATHGADYLILIESHGTNHTQLHTEDAPKIEGYEVVGGGGSNDKSMFMYKRVANVDVATVEGNLGSATVTRVYSDKNLGFDAWTTDPSYFDSRTLVEPPANSIGIYAEDEGSKGDRPARFAAAGFEVVYGAEGSDDKMMVMPTSFTRQETPNGNGAEGFIYEKT